MNDDLNYGQETDIKGERLNSEKVQLNYNNVMLYFLI